MNKTGMLAVPATGAVEGSGLTAGAIRAGLFAMMLVVALLTAGGALAQQAAVNVNTATPEELSLALTGVGLAKARRIVEYREMHGPFEHPDELAEVRGIGPATVDRNRERIALE